MAAQAHRLFIYRRLIGEDGGLGEDAALVHSGGLEHLLHTAQQLFTIGGNSLRRTLLHLAYHLLDGADTGGNILRQFLTFHGTHGVIGGQRCFRHGNQVGSHALQVLFRLGNGKYIRETGQGRGAHIAFQIEALLQMAQGFIIIARQRVIDGDYHFLCAVTLDGDEHIHLTAGDGLLHATLDSILGEDIGAGHLHGAVQITVIDRTNLNSDVSSVQCLLCSTVTGHTFDHSRSFLSKRRGPSFSLVNNSRNIRRRGNRT